MNKKKIIIFLGPPGSGKGTQSDVLGEKLKLPVISPGELLRYEEEKNTKLGKSVEKKINQGKLVSSDIIEKLVEKRLKKNDARNGFILDGYPRRLEQLVWLEKKLAKFEDKVIMVFYVKVSNKEVKARISGRRVCGCGAAYHLKYNPPKKKNRCDICGRELEIRDDDIPAIITDRLKTFHHHSKPMLSYYKKKGYLFTIDGEQSIQKIEKSIFDIAKKLIKI